MTGLEEEFVRRAGGRLEIGAYLREVFREQGKIGSVYDSNVTSFDPFPFAPDQRANDPLLESIIAPTTTAMVDFVTRVVGWKTDARYNALSYEVNRPVGHVERARLRAGAVPDLREAVAADPKLRVLIVHGWNDLSCPFMGSVLTVDQMPRDGRPHPRSGARVSRRPHVLQPAGQPGRAAQGRAGDVRQALTRTRRPAHRLGPVAARLRFSYVSARDRDVW